MWGWCFQSIQLHGLFYQSTVLVFKMQFMQHKVKDLYVILYFFSCPSVLSCWFSIQDTYINTFWNIKYIYMYLFNHCCSTLICTLIYYIYLVSVLQWAWKTLHHCCQVNKSLQLYVWIIIPARQCFKPHVNVSMLTC